jgi:hypothetical protein
MVELSAIFFRYVPFAPDGLAFTIAVEKGFDVLRDGFFRERHLADASVNNTRFLDTELNSTALGVFNCLRDVRSDRADFWVWHQAARAKNFTETTDNRHHVWRGDHTIESPSFRPEPVHQVFSADDIAPASFASSAFASRANTATRIGRPVPAGRLHTPRTIWSA